LVKGLKDAEIDENAIQIIKTIDREVVKHMLHGINQSIDVIVPRGGKSLVSMVEKEARVPVFAHLEGICHIFVDKSANQEKALNICLNAKMRRPGICGAVETILVHSDIADEFMPFLVNALKAQACEIRGCVETQKFNEHIFKATEEDWSTEYLLPIVSIRIVNSLNEALEHIELYSSGHTESILTEDPNRASRFQKELDSAIVMHNVSTQFADGGEFGLGGEIGIATGKFHARGPVGVDQLTSFKYLVNGNGHTRP
jgi:glutamate-5-semialdehyde dehydrogenase